MFQKVDYVMAMVSDMRRSVDFYQNLLGLKLKFQTPGWTEFDTGSTTLALHIAEPGTPAATEPRAGSCTFGFSVEDLDQTFQQLKERGVRFVREPELRQKEGIRLAVCLDPDGLPISLAQPVRAAAHG
ncbi:MAG: VOC family protein [Candidatus Eremiobacterota bacterium]